MDNTRLYRSLFLIDDTRNYTNDFYIFEFTKIVLFREGCFAIPIEDICEKIEVLTSLEYTKEDIVHAISVWNNGDIEVRQGLYSLSSAGSERIAKREKQNDIKIYIAHFLRERSGQYDTSKEDVERLLEKFIYQRFNENLKEISDILNHCHSIADYDKDYDEKEKTLINDFLAWDNYEKNKCVFRLIAKAYDYCMINSKCECNAIEFSKICFYLDSNIIFRLMGINGTEREFSVKSLIDRCKTLGVNLVVSNFVKEECEYTINSQLEVLIDSTARMNNLIPPATMSFAEEKSIRMDFYRRYYDWVRAGNKHRNYDSFKKSILKEFNKLLETFNRYEDRPSFKVVSGSNFAQYYDSLYTIKQDKHTAETDINSVLLVLENRRHSNDNEYFFITADQKLIGWLREVFPAQKSIADFPSAWFSIMLKYTGREKDSDYKAFCQFIHLAIEPQIEDLEKKIAIKSNILSSDIDDDIKAMMIDEVRENYHHYKEYEPENVVHVAYGKAKSVIENEVEQRKDIEFSSRVEKLEEEFRARFDQQQEVFNARLIEQKNDLKRIETNAVLDAYKRGQEEYANEIQQAKIEDWVNKILTRNRRVRRFFIILAWILFSVAVGAMVLLYILGVFKSDSPIVQFYQANDILINIVGVFSNIFSALWNVSIKKFNIFPIEKEVVLNKVRTKKQ